MQTIGGTIKRLREARGLTQPELAALLEVAATTLSRWETGKVQAPSRAHLRRLCEVLQVSREELQGLPSASPERRADQLQPLRDAIRTVQAAGDAALEEFIRQVIEYVERRWPRLGGQK